MPRDANSMFSFTTEVVASLQKHSIQWMIVKDVDNDELVWCSDAAAEAMGTTVGEIIGPCSEFWPEHKLYQIDDLKVVNSGIPKLNYLEFATAPDGHRNQVLTNKWPVVFGGKRYVMIACVNITELLQSIDETTEHGSAFDFSALDEAALAMEALETRLKGTTK